MTTQEQTNTSTIKKHRSIKTHNTQIQQSVKQKQKQVSQQTNEQKQNKYQKIQTKQTSRTRTNNYKITNDHLHDDVQHAELPSSQLETTQASTIWDNAVHLIVTLNWVWLKWPTHHCTNMLEPFLGGWSLSVPCKCRHVSPAMPSSWSVI